MSEFLANVDVTAVIVAAIGASGGLLGGIFAYLHSRAANRRSADVEGARLALENSQASWARAQQIIDRLTREVDRLDKALASAREEMDASRQSNADLRRRVTEMEAALERMRTVVNMLVAELEMHGLPIPEVAHKP